MKINLDVLEEYLTRQQLLKLGLISLLLGVTFFVIAYFLITGTIKSVTSAKEAGDRNVSQDACMSSLRSLGGLNVRSDGGSIVVLSAEGLENAALKLGEASVASLVCPGWELSNFCLGESCENGEGLLFELKIID